MRNRRLLTLAVLAVALGFAPFVMAETAVVTVVMDPGGVGGTYDINYTIAGGTSIGSASSSVGALDFILKSIKGTGDLVVGSASIVGPQGMVTDTTTDVNAGFNTVNGFREVVAGVADGVSDAQDAGAFNVTCVQPVAYGASFALLENSAVLLGIGTVGSAGAPALPGTISWVGTAPDYATDTRMVTGGYTVGAGGTVGVTTFGVNSFSVLPNNGSGGFTGPLDETTYLGELVQAVVIQTTTGVGNNGGRAASTNATELKVEVGDVILGGDYASNAQVTLLLNAPNTSITLAANQNIGGLDIQAAGTGYQALNVNASTLNIYGGDVNAIKALVGDSTDGLYSSQVDLANEVLVVTSVGGDHVAVKATVYGDMTLDGAVDGFDYTILATNWLTAKDEWSMGDLNNDGFIDGFDYTILATNWLTSFSPTGGSPAAPEPATMALLALGGLGVLSRRRRS